METARKRRAARFERAPPVSETSAARHFSFSSNRFVSEAEESDRTNRVSVVTMVLLCPCLSSFIYCFGDGHVCSGLKASQERNRETKAE